MMKTKIAFAALIISLIISLLYISIIAEDVSSLEIQVQEANNKISVLNRDLEKASQEKRDLSQELEFANQTLQNQKDALADLREQVSSLNGQLKALKSNTQTEVSTNSQATTFSITGAYDVTYENSVGNDWSCTYSVDGDGLCLGDTLIAAVGDVIKISVVVTENDNSPDTGSNSVTRTLSYDDIVHGFSTTLNVYVKENRGRYAGNTATVRVKLTFTPKH